MDDKRMQAKRYLLNRAGCLCGLFGLCLVLAACAEGEVTEGWERLTDAVGSDGEEATNDGTGGTGTVDDTGQSTTQGDVPLDGTPSDGGDVGAAGMRG